MATPRQIAANRLNSQKSTGPRTAAGKAVSRMNALQSGLHAESLIVRGEDAAALDRLSAEYHAEFLPVTPRERDLVDTLVHNQWLIRRLRLTEADLWAHHFEQRDDDFDPKYHHRVVRQRHPLADGFNSLNDRFARLQSRLNSLERSSRNALKELRQLQAGRESLLPDTDPPSEPIDHTAGCVEIGFVPSSPVEPGVQPASPAVTQLTRVVGLKAVRSAGGGMPPC